MNSALKDHCFSVWSNPLWLFPFCWSWSSTNPKTTLFYSSKAPWLESAIEKRLFPNRLYFVQNICFAIPTRYWVFSLLFICFLTMFSQTLHMKSPSSIRSPRSQRHVRIMFPIFSSVPVKNLNSVPVPCDLWQLNQTWTHKTGNEHWGTWRGTHSKLGLSGLEKAPRSKEMSFWLRLAS